jgi:hypothetical protein
MPGSVDDGRLVRRTLFLVPDRLRCYFILLGFGFAVILLLSQERGWHAATESALTLVGCTVLLPWLVYVQLRSPVLSLGPDALDGAEQLYLDAGLGCLCIGRGVMSWRLVACMLYLSVPTVTTYWAPRVTRERAFVKRAMLGLIAPAMLADGPQHGRAGLLAFSRCILLWAAPLWSAYLVLWLLLFLAAIDKATAFRLVTMWAAVVLGFILREGSNLHEDLIFRRAQAVLLPGALSITPSLQGVRRKVDQLMRPIVRHGLEVSLLVLVGLYIAAADIVASDLQSARAGATAEGTKNDADR